MICFAMLSRWILDITPVFFHLFFVLLVVLLEHLCQRVVAEFRSEKGVFYFSAVVKLSRSMIS